MSRCALRLWFAILLALVLLSTVAGAAPPPVDTLLGELDADKAETRTLAGEFTQHHRAKLFKKELVSTGRLYYQRPDQIRWEYLTPDPSRLVLDGQRATLFMPGQAAQRFDLGSDATLRAIFDQLLLFVGPGSFGAAKEDYEISVGGSERAPLLRLVPKADRLVARAFARIELGLERGPWRLRHLLLVEKSGDEKRIDFTRLERNGPLPEGAFAPGASADHLAPRAK